MKVTARAGIAALIALIAAAAALLPLASPALAAGAAAARVVPGPPSGPVPRGFRPVSFTFVSPSEGWVLGTAPCAHQPCTSVVMTADGGQSWVGIPAPKTPLGSPGSRRGVSTIRFADPLDGFAFGPQLWATHDGGASWQRVRLPGRVGDLETAAGVVYAAVETAQGDVTVYSSPAGGGQWTPVPGLPAQVPGGAFLGAITLHGTAGWIILGNRLYATATGQTWVREGVKCPHFFRMASTAAYNTRHLTLLCQGLAGAGSAEKILYASRDGGAQFQRAGKAPLGGDNFDLLAQPTTRHVFIATDSGATWLDVSLDGGRTWNQQLFIPGGANGWSDFGFTTSTQGAAIDGFPVKGSHMYMTSDAGDHWHKIRF